MFGNFFSSNKTEKDKQINDIELPKGHANVSMDDKEKCPYFQFKTSENNDNEQNPQEDLLEKSLKKKQKKKKQQGGCPFMTSEKKRNPALENFQDAYNVVYISPLNYLLDYKGLPNQERKFQFRKEKNTIFQRNREKFDQYPIFLKHTLFHEGMEKVRNLQVSQRFFVYDQLREKGNKNYFKGKYADAILCYEKALSCFRWLELIDEEELEEIKRRKEESKSDEPYNALSIIQKQIEENRKKQLEEQQELLKKKQQQTQDQAQDDTQDDFSQQAFSEINSEVPDDVRSDVAIDDDEDYFERELQDMYCFF